MFEDFMEQHHFIGTNYILINHNILFQLSKKNNSRAQIPTSLL